MEERLPSPPRTNGQHRDSGGSDGGDGDGEANPDLTLVPNHQGPEHPLNSDTYVVQIPKDQIYRVPPPENALIVERHRKPVEVKKRSCCRSSCCCCLIPAIIAIILAVIIVAVVSSILLKLKSPNFHVDHFLVKDLTKPHDKNAKLAYDVKLKVKNPNAYTMTYEQGGVVSLAFKQKAVAKGKYAPFDQAGKTSKVVDIVLKGSSTALPKEMQESLKSKHKTKKHVTFALHVDVPARRNIWNLKGSISRYVTACQFTVDTLGKDARVLSQDCQTERKDS
ncbi:hypothetical protein BT93_F1909 [Corymbia citriodora subsp. variegata]|nr:hypothetical protein BT93_F1909 [Corymbia citriodora subsp. variegata]